MLPLDPMLEGKRLYLMRHGKTYEPDLDTMMVSAEDDPGLPLTADGKAGVARTARALAELELEAAFSSTFHRSLETARRVAEPHGLEVNTRSELEELRLYPEQRDLRGTARAYVELAKRLKSEPVREIRLGGVPSERSLGQIIDEAFAALHDCLSGPARRVLVVAHGGLNRLLLAGLMDIPLDRFISIDQDFACVNVIEFVRRGRPWVRAINATTDDPFKGNDIRA
jgi:broad specificity phosphatase PhoE